MAGDIRAAGGDALAVPTDVGVEAEVEALAAAAVERYGRFDTWVNNAGLSIFGHILEVSVRDMHRMFDTVYWASSTAPAPPCATTSTGTTNAGAIVNVGSLFDDRATTLQSTYASAKHGVHGATEALRMELERGGAPVSVTLVHPGRIDTPYNEHAQAYIPDHPAHRVMVYEPETVAGAILQGATPHSRDLYIGAQAKGAGRHRAARAAAHRPGDGVVPGTGRLRCRSTGHGGRRRVRRAACTSPVAGPAASAAATAACGAAAVST